jgi:ribosomal protein S18 acetylase RimI-like enzyme
MSVLPLGEGFAGSYTSEPATGAHVLEVFEIVAAECTAAYGFCPVTVDDVQAELEYPRTALSKQRLIRAGQDGTAVQWWVVMQEPGNPVVSAKIRSHPRLTDAIGDELARVGWATMLDWIREAAATGQDEVQIRSACYPGGASGRRGLEAAGFVHERTIWEMTGSVNAANRKAHQVEGLSIVPVRDLHTVHRIEHEAFVGAWDYEATVFDDWLVDEEAQPGFDTGLWRLAEIDGTPAAVMTMSRRSATQGSLYIGDLATLAPYRRRGIASALLAHAFDVAAAEGYDRVDLHVDSESPDDAPSVYRRAGLEVRSAKHVFTRRLSLDETAET